MKVAWNAIVKNEAAVLERCVKSLLPHVDCAVVVDTGSTDGTPALLTKLFTQAGKPLQIAYEPFHNFSQARNDALKVARQSPLEFDYMLLVDADMELKVNTPKWINGHRGEAYDVKQTAGSVSYYNRRLLHRRSDAVYRGVTHEYLAVETDGILSSVEFIDHADGANRPLKFQRDVDLLTEALKIETDPGLIQRYHYYLARSYFDLKEWRQAAEHFKLRTTLGGFDEEVWNAQLHYAHCLGNLDDHAGFVFEMLKAYEMRPSRAEVLYDLANYYRKLGDNHTALLLAGAGGDIPYPKNDLLFVNDFVYETGFDEETSICGYYSKAYRAYGFAACNRLLLSRKAPAAVRGQAAVNLYWYLQPLKTYIPSLRTSQMMLTPPENYSFTNPSVVAHNNDLVVLLRAVNYKISPEGRYHIQDGGDAIRTRNFIFDICRTSNIIAEVAMPGNWPDKPSFEAVQGLEDCRLFTYGDKLYASATVRELSPQGWCEMVLLPVNAAHDAFENEWQEMRWGQSKVHEKNWMPFPHPKLGMRFVYRLGTLVNSYGAVVAQHNNELATAELSGGSGVVEADGRYLAIVHQAGFIPGRPNRYYSHRFVQMDERGAVLKVSSPFVFCDRQIEFCAGLAYLPEKRQLTASFGVMDREAWLAHMPLDEVLQFLDTPS